MKFVGSVGIFCQRTIWYTTNSVQWWQSEDGIGTGKGTHIVTISSKFDTFEEHRVSASQVITLSGQCTLLEELGSLNERDTFVDEVSSLWLVIVVEPWECSQQEVCLWLHVVIQEQDKVTVHLFVEEDIVVVTGLVVVV